MLRELAKEFNLLLEKISNDVEITEVPDTNTAEGKEVINEFYEDLDLLVNIGNRIAQDGPRYKSDTMSYNFEDDEITITINSLFLILFIEIPNSKMMGTFNELCVEYNDNYVDESGTFDLSYQQSYIELKMRFPPVETD